jgi:hypothetical protein
MEPDSRFWTPAIRDGVNRRFGAVSGVTPLGGMSGAGVWRLRLASGRSVIAKAIPWGAEPVFYRQVAPRLTALGVPTPILEWSFDEPDVCWLFLEDIPTPLPRERWLADPEMCAILRRLHTLPPNDSLRIEDGYRPEWSDAMTERALALLPSDESPAIGDMLRRLQSARRHLFRDGGLISGDPNPTNWGIRANGALVLFDWERFSRGAPALDLAITAPGLGDADAFRQIARQYLDDTGDAADWLARDIALAKVWSVVEFLANVTDAGDSPASEVGKQILPHLPGWFREMAGTLG